MSGVILSESCPVCYDNYEHEGYWLRAKMSFNGCSHSVCKLCSHQIEHSCPCCRAPFSQIIPADVDVDDEMMLLSEPVETIPDPSIPIPVIPVVYSTDPVVIRDIITEVGYELEPLMDIVKNMTYQRVILEDGELFEHFNNYYYPALELYKLQ